MIDEEWNNYSGYDTDFDEREGCTEREERRGEKGRRGRLDRGRTSLQIDRRFAGGYYPLIILRGERKRAVSAKIAAFASDVPATP